MQKRRLVLIALVALALAPGTWIRSERDVGDLSSFAITPLSIETPVNWPDSFVLEGAWHLDADLNRFGGFSALVALDAGSFAAFTDRGDRMHFSSPGGQYIAPEIAEVRQADGISYVQDIESASRNPETGQVWLGYENANAIVRLDADGRTSAVFPQQMKGWGENSGPEAMVRLSDGNFIVLAESLRTGLLFPSDPVEGNKPISFAVNIPGGYDVTDMAQLPDGRTLVLLRQLAVGYPPFSSAIAIADPATISANVPWELELLLTLDDVGLRENYEGLAVVPQADGQVDLWLISDDNISALQRTILLKIGWKPNTKKKRAGP